MILTATFLLTVLSCFELHTVLCLIDETNTFCHRLNNCSRHHENSDRRVQPLDAARTIYFGLMLAYPDPLKRRSFASAFDDGHNIAPAAYAAVEQINNRTDLLGNYTVELIRFDGGCSVTERTAVGLNDLICSCKPVVGIVGPSCGLSAEMVSRATGTSQFAMVSMNYGEMVALGDRSKYPYAFGMLGSSLVFAKAFVELMKHNNWIKIALLWTDSGVDGYDIGRRIQRDVRNTNFEIVFASSVTEYNIPFNELEFYYVRVIVLFTPPEITLRTLCLAYHHGLVYPKCQWVFKERINTDFHEISFSYRGVMYSCSETDISNSLRGSINLVLNALSEPGSDNIENEINTTYEQYMMQYALHRKQYTQKFNVTSTETLWSRGIYDAVWLLANALNDSLQELSMDLTQIIPGNVEVAQMLQRYLLKLEFRGISGRIKFDNETGFNIDSRVNIHQYGGMNNETIVGFYMNQKLTLHLHAHVPEFINATFAEETVSVNMYILVLFYVITFVILLLVIPVHLVTIIYRNHRAIKASSPRLNHLIFLGCYLILVGTFVFIVAHSIKSGPSLSSLCVAIPWIITPGTTLITGTVCMKTWRLYRIYSASKKFLIIKMKKKCHKKQKKLCMSDSMLSVGVAVLVTVDLVICLIWTVSDPLKEIRHKEIVQDSDHSLPVIKVDVHCESSEHTIYWSVIIVTYKGFQTLCSLILAVGTRMKKKEFNTKNVIVLAYALSIVVGLGVPLYTIFAIINVSSTVQFVALCVILHTVVFVCLVILFYPTVILLFLSQ